MCQSSVGSARSAGPSRPGSQARPIPRRLAVGILAALLLVLPPSPGGATAGGAGLAGDPFGVAAVRHFRSGSGSGSTVVYGDLGPLHADARLGGAADLERAAREALAQSGATRAIDLGDLRLERRARSPLGTHLYFGETVNGLPVFGSDVALHVAPSGRIFAVTASAGPAIDPAVAAGEPLLDRDLACAASALAVGLDPSAAVRSSVAAELGLVRGAGGPATGGASARGPTLAWRVELDAPGPGGAWEVLVDAETGEAIGWPRSLAGTAHASKASRPSGSGSARSGEAAPAAGVATTGRGDAFVPNAVVANGMSNIADDNDSASSVPQRAYSEVDLPDLDGSGTLTGPYVTTAPTANHVVAPDGDFTGLTRADDGFEEVESYWAISTAQAYLRDALGLDVASYQIPVDAHAFEDDLSSFERDSRDSAKGRINLGDGGVDDGEDAEVLWILYGIAVFASQRPEVPDLNLPVVYGFADYFTATLSTTVPGDPRFHATIAEWDATFFNVGSEAHPYPHLRAVDGRKQYPQDLRSGEHPSFDGEILSSSYWALHQAVGREAADPVIFSANFLLPADPEMPDVAAAVLEADVQLNGGANAEAIRAAFRSRGIVAGFVVKAASPDSAAPRSTLTVTIAGGGFADGAKVSFGKGVKVLESRVVSPSEIEVRIKVKRKATDGPRHVTVTNPDGTATIGLGLFHVAGEVTSDG